MKLLENLLGRLSGDSTKGSENYVIGYKSIEEDMTSTKGSQKWTVGDWYKYDGPLRMGYNGFHASTDLFSLYSLYKQGDVLGDRLFKVEARGNVLKDKNRFVASEMRLVKEIDLKRLSVDYAASCARHVLNRYEVVYPDDSRPRSAIEAAEKWLKYPTEVKIGAVWRAARFSNYAAESAKTAALSASSAALAAKTAGWSTSSPALAAQTAAWSAYSACYSNRRGEIKWQKNLLKGLVQKYYLDKTIA